MSERHDLKLSCSCGAQLIYSEVVSDKWASKSEYERTAFLAAHAEKHRSV